MKSLYEGSSRANAVLIMTDDQKAVKARLKERKTSRKGPGSRHRIMWWVEDAPLDAVKYDKGKGGGPWTNYQSTAVPLVR